MRSTHRFAHVVVAVVVLAAAGLALAGLVGRPGRDERFDAKRIEVSPAAPAHPDGIRVRQVVDQDFGTNDRRGFQLNISDSYGVPVDVEASSPDAPADLDIAPTAVSTRIRVGDPDTTVSGQHRYVLAYTQPDAGVQRGRLVLDAVYAGEQLETGRFEVVVNGFDLRSPRCRVGTEIDVDDCTLRRDGDVWRAVVEPLPAGSGIRIEAAIAATTEPTELPLPPLPPRIADRRLLVAALVLLAGGATALAVFLVSARRGRNQVFGGGATDAAFTAFGDGALPPPGMATTLVSDARLGDLATIEFVPPKAIAPWQGALLLRERVDERSIGAWFSGLAANDVLRLDQHDGEVVLKPGPAIATADGDTAALLSTAFDGRSSIELGAYDEDFASAWADIRAMQQRELVSSGWWLRPPASIGGASHRMGIGIVIWVVVGAGWFATRLLGMFGSIGGALAFGVLSAGTAAFLAYRSLLPARSATGSALTLRTESFRRFLERSEGRHVEWAWEQGLVRQYSAWAVALDAADAWQHAMGEANVPPAELDPGGVLVAYSLASALSSTAHAPSTSGGGGGFGGGGFSGGSVGGGAGGGGSSSGSW